MNPSQELFKRSYQVTPGGVHSPVRSFRLVDHPPVYFDSGQGAYLTSIEGKKYIDFCQSFGPNLLGHRDPEVQEKLIEIINKVWTLGALDPYSVELTEWVVNRVPFIDKLRFVCSGTEAVMSALRLARAFTGRQKVLKFEGCYHGHVDNMLVKSGSGLAGLSESSSLGVESQSVSNTLIGHLNDIEQVREIFSKFGDEIACVIMEPLPANYGLLVQKEEFIKEVFDLAKKNSTLVLFDEVISGFRVGISGMAGRLGLEPDLVTYGKVIGGGFPVGAYGAKKEIMSLVAPEGGVYQAGTLAANPVGMVAGLATLQKIERLNIYSLLEERTKKFVNNLSKKINEKALPWQVVQYSSLFWIAPRSNSTIRSPQHFPQDMGKYFGQFFSKCLEKGLYMAPNPYEVSFVSWAHSEEILDESSEIILSSLEELNVDH